jgi:hypothetical protein
MRRNSGGIDPRSLMGAEDENGSEADDREFNEQHKDELASEPAARHKLHQLADHRVTSIA